MQRGMRAQTNTNACINEPATAQAGIQGPTHVYWYFHLQITDNQEVASNLCFYSTSNRFGDKVP